MKKKIIMMTAMMYDGGDGDGADATEEYTRTLLHT